MITLNDLNKIEVWLKGRSVKDTSFPVATSMDSTDFVPVVKNNRNCIITFHNFIKSLGIVDSVNAVINKMIGRPRGIAPLDINAKVPEEYLPNFIEVSDIPQRIVTNVQKVKGVPFGFEVMTNVYMDDKWITTSGNEYTIPYASNESDGLISKEDYVSFSDPISNITFSDDGDGLYISIETPYAYEHEAPLPYASNTSSGVLSVEGYKRLNSTITHIEFIQEDGKLNCDIAKDNESHSFELPVAMASGEGTVASDGLMSAEDKTMVDSIKEALTASQGFFVTEVRGRLTDEGFSISYTANNADYFGHESNPNDTTNIEVIPYASSDSGGLMTSHMVTELANKVNTKLAGYDSIILKEGEKIQDGNSIIRAIKILEARVSELEKS